MSVLAKTPESTPASSTAVRELMFFTNVLISAL
jgi:hypothetical protein